MQESERYDACVLRDKAGAENPVREWGFPQLQSWLGEEKRFSHLSLLKRFLRYAEQKLHLNYFSSFVAVTLEMM